MSIGREGEGTRGKTGKGRLNPDKIGFWSPKIKRFGFYQGSHGQEILKHICFRRVTGNSTENGVERGEMNDRMGTIMGYESKK